MPTTYAIPKGSDYFDAVTYTGTSGSPANQSITSLNFQPDFGWWKKRSAAYDHCLIDAVRGVTKQLYSNLTNAEGTDSAPLISFDSNGFTVGNSNYTNYGTQVAWCWKANGSGSSNTSGSITSTVSANTTSGFSVVTYTGTSASSATIGHGLGVKPAMIIWKCRSNAENWPVWHQSSSTNQLHLNETAAATSSWYTYYMNGTQPTSTVFSVSNDGTHGQDTFGNGRTYVAYCFAEVAGFSKFSSYTGNGSSDGPFIYTGFLPKYVLIKASSTTSGWNVVDGSRSPSNVVDDVLFPNLSDAEGTFNWLDFTSNGFKIRNTLAGSNTNGTTYIYMAFAQNPFKYANAR